MGRDERRTGRRREHIIIGVAEVQLILKKAKRPR